jgi:chromosome partitioning protein
MKTVAVAMGKGGTGKTTVAVHLAAGLARQGKRVLLADLDPTAHATAWLLGLDAVGGKGMADALREDRLAPEHLREVAERPGLTLLPATRALAGAEHALASEEGGQAILRGLLQQHSDRWDYAFLDCPPNLGFYSISALCAADGILAPLPCAFLSLAGLRLLEESVARVQKRLGARAQLLGYLLFGADAREAITEQTREVLERDAGELLYRTEVRVSTAAKALPARRLTAWDEGADQRGAEDYAGVLKETLERLAGMRRRQAKGA